MRKFFEEFCANAYFLRGLNANFVNLIPKLRALSLLVLWDLLDMLVCSLCKIVLSF